MLIIVYHSGIPLQNHQNGQKTNKQTKRKKTKMNQTKIPDNPRFVETRTCLNN